MNKFMNKLMILVCFLTAAIAPLHSDQQKRGPRSLPQPRLFDVKIQELKEIKLSQASHKNAAWGANIVGKTIGTLYSMEARLATPALLFTDSIHKRIYANEKKRREKWVNWLGEDHPQKDKKDIEFIAELASLEGHRYAYHHKTESWAFLSANIHKQELHSPDLKQVIDEICHTDKTISQF